MIIPKTPPGHVRALVERAWNPTLAEAANIIKTGGDATEYLERFARANPSPGLVIDPTFGALPIARGAQEMEGSDDEENLNIILNLGDQTQKYLVGGFVEVSSDGTVPGFIDKDPVHSDPFISSFLNFLPPTCGDSPAVGNAGTVRHKLHTHTLADYGLDGSGVSLAIVDSGIFLPRITQPLGAMKPLAGPPPTIDVANSWKFDVVTEPFFHRLGHGTMCAYDALIAAPKATLIDIAMLLARPVAEHGTQATVSAALKAYYHLITRRASGQINTQGLVVSNSWGIYHPSLEDFPPGSPFRFIDNPNHIFRLYVRALTQAGADIVFCGHN